MLGLITASNEVMQNASKVANGYKTILTNLMTKDLEEQFNEFGLTMRDQNGEMKDAFVILKELAEVYNSLGTTIDGTTGETISLNDNMNKLLKDIGGAYNINILTSGFSNFDIALKATESAMNSADSASNEYAIALDTVEKKTESLLGQFQELVLGDGGLTQFIKILIDTGTTILKFANSDLGQLIIKLGLLYTTINLTTKGFSLLSKTGVANLIKDFIALKSGAQTVVSSTLAMDLATKGFITTLLASAKAWAISPFGMITIAVGSVTVLSKIIDAVNVTLEETVERAEKSAEAFNTQKQKVQGLTDEIKSLKEQLDKLENSSENSETIKNLEIQIGLLESELAIEKSIADEKQRQAEADAQKVLNKESSFNLPVVSESPYSPGMIFQDTHILQGTSTEALKTYTQSIVEAKLKLSEYIDEAKKIKSTEGENSDAYLLVSNKIKQQEELLKRLNEESNDVAKTIQKQVKVYGDNTSAVENEVNALEDWTKVTSENKKEQETQEKAQKSTFQTIKDGIEQRKRITEATKDEMDVISTLASELDDITSAYQLAADAQYEYAQQGYLSLDTYSQLMQMQPEYLAMMFDENGQLLANADATNILYQQKVLEMGVTAARAQIKLATELSDEAGAYARLGQEAFNASSGVKALVQAQLEEAASSIKSQEDIDALNKKIDAIDQITKSTIANVGAITASYQPTNRNTSATNKNTSARNSNANATKAQTEALKAQKKALEDEADALEKEIDNYEIVIDYVKDLIKEEQEALEEAKDKELQAIQDKIDALEKEQEVFEENIDAQIEALEKQRDEVEKSYDDQINKIQEENKVLEENLKLKELQENLARAKTQKVKIFKDGQFVYAQDEEAISKAEQELADYEAQLAVQRQIEELERLKEEALQSIDDQIDQLEQAREDKNKTYEQELEDLQNHYNKVEAEYDAQIQQLDNYLKQFENMLNASAKKHAEILYKELVGEQNTWDERMKALSNFVSNYESKKNQLNGIKAQIDSITAQISSLEGQSRAAISSAQNNLNAVKNIVGQINELNRIKTWGYFVKDKYGNIVLSGEDGNALGSFQSQGEAERSGMQYLNQYIQYMKEKGKDVSKDGLRVTTVGRYAQGIYSVPDDQISLVADPLSPSNRELVVGSKINKGVGILTNLKKGSGVIPAGQNLTENLVRLAQWSGNGGLERAVQNTNNNVSKIIQIENINLPEVKNANDFVQYLENNFMNDTIQFANAII